MKVKFSISKKTLLIAILSVTANWILLGQNVEKYRLEGVIYDNNTKEVLIGATIYCKELEKGTVSDKSGYFILNLPYGVYTIDYSYIGYRRKSELIELPDNKYTEVFLSPAEHQLEEVRVTTQRKFFGNMEYGREIPSIDAEIIEQQNINNASDILHGRLAGVWATKTSGSPGDHQKIRIRGQNSLFTSAEPLYVIDGVPVPIVNLSSLGIADLNIHDIENVTVLKDASSTALFGYQGGNGVILIDTKEGQDNEIGFTTRLGVQWFNNFYPLMSTQEQYEMFDIAYNKELYNLKRRYPEYSDTLCDHDRQEEIFSNALSREYQLNAGGTINKFSYYISGNYTDQEGILPYAHYKRYTLSAKIGRRFGKYIALNLSYRGSLQENDDNQDQFKGNRLLFEGLTRSPCLECIPDGLFYEPDGKLKQGIFFNYAPLNAIEQTSSIADDYHHSLDITNHALNVSAKLRLSEHWSINLMESLLLRSTVYAMNYKYYLYSYYNVYQRIILLESEEDVTLFNQQYSINYINSLGEHEFNLAAAYRNYTDNLWWEVDTVEGELNTYSYLRNSMAAYGLQGSVVRTISSYVTNASYSYKNKYFFSLVGNLSHMKEGVYIDYYTLFPSIAVSYDLAREKFMQNISSITFLKPYINYGISGNYPLNGLGNDLFEYVGYAYGSNGLSEYPVIHQFANHALKHESTTELDFGIQLSLFDNRLVINGVHYLKNIDNLIIQRDIPLYYGGGKEYYNIGKIDVSGYEFGIEMTPVLRNDLQWHLSANVSRSKQLVRKLYEEQPLVFYDDDILMPRFIIMQDQELGSIYGYHCLGKWTPEDELRGGNSFIENFGMKYLNADSSNTFLNEDDMVKIGNSIPDLTGNLNTTLHYKEFTLRMQWYAVIGNEKFNATRTATIMAAVNKDVYTYLSDSIAALRYVFIYRSSEFVEDASFLRLKTIQLSYEPKKALFRKVDTRFSIGFENLLVLTRYKGFDPEATIFTDNNFSDNAIDRGSVPIPRSIYFSVSIKL